MKKKIVLLFAMVLSLNAFATCYKKAGKMYAIDPVILKAIAVVESGQDPNAIRVNKNKTLDYGLMQINSVHLESLEKKGVTSADLMNGCTNVKVAAKLVRHKINRWGYNWYAIGAYHSETPKFNIIYQQKVIDVYTKLRRT